jgi:peptidoglycan/xylan/chitin deacetylase (PgdA/CDA1 family)
MTEARSLRGGQSYDLDYGLLNPLHHCGLRLATYAGVALHKTLGASPASGRGILTYHRTAPVLPGLPRPLHNVPPARIRDQLLGLLKGGFRIRSLGEVLRSTAAGEEIPAKTVVITFDDGYESVYRYAWPVLQELQLPATVFLCTAFLDDEEPFPFDQWGRIHQGRAAEESYRPLRTDQCLEMMAGGLIELGAHTHTHQDFRGDSGAFREDLQRCVEVLQERFGIHEATFAFPYGCPNAGFAGAELMAVAKETGVRCALTTVSDTVDVTTDPFGWGRFHVFEWETSAALAAKIEGWYSWAPRLRRRAASVVTKGALAACSLFSLPRSVREG